MKTRISLVFVALVAALTIPAVASANGGGHHGPPAPPPNVPVLYAPPITAGSGICVFVGYSIPYGRISGAVVVGAAPSMIVLADGVLLMLLGAAAAIGGFT